MLGGIIYYMTKKPDEAVRMKEKANAATDQAKAKVKETVKEGIDKVAR